MQVWYFEAFATSAVLYPLLNLYFRRIGLTATQIGILAAVRPWTSALAGNVWAVLGDYTGSHKTILMFTYVSTVLVRYCLGEHPDLAGHEVCLAPQCKQLLKDPLLCRRLKNISASLHACASHRGAVCTHSDLSRCVVDGCREDGMHV